jgi:hypothetical protein
VELVAAHPFLGRAKQEHGLEPNVELDLGALETGADCHSELLAAILTFPKARTVRLPLKPVVVAYNAAVRAYRAVRPLDALKVFAGFIRVLEVGLV